MEQVDNIPVYQIKLELFGIYRSFEEARKDLQRLRDVVTYRQWEYNQGYYKAQKDRRAAAEPAVYIVATLPLIRLPDIDGSPSVTLLVTDVAI